MVLTDETLPRALKLLSEPLRLRILGLLSREELSVGELSRALGLSQSRVSNHLRQLREAGLLAERHAGTSTFLRLAPPAAEGVTGRLWATLSVELSALAEHAADLVRLASVLTERRGRGEAFFDRLAGDWDVIAGEFSSGQARQRAAAHLLPHEFVVADLGCGTGYMAHALYGNVSKLICVDSSQGMLEEAERRFTDLDGRTEVELRRGELDDLPLADAEVHGVVAGMVLHHSPELDRPLAEMRRVLAPGGAAAVLELAPHREAWMREELGDRHLGLEPGDVVAAMRRAGFEDIRLDLPEDTYRPRRRNASGGKTPELPLYIVRGRAARTSTD